MQKAIQLLELFINEEEISLHQIAEMADIPKPTAYRLLTALEAGGLLYKEKENPHDSRYGLGLKLLELGNLVSSRLDIRKIALPLMEELAGDLNEVVHLVIESQQEAIYIEKVQSKRTLSLQTFIGRSVPLYIGSGPKLLLASMPRDVQQNIIQDADETLTNQRIDHTELIQELENIHNQGYAISISEQDADTTGISFPVYDNHGDVIAALAISGLSSRFTGDRLEEMKLKGKSCANAISRLLGYQIPVKRSKG